MCQESQNADFGKDTTEIADVSPRFTTSIRSEEIAQLLRAAGTKGMAQEERTDGRLEGWAVDASERDHRCDCQRDRRPLTPSRK